MSHQKSPPRVVQAGPDEVLEIHVRGAVLVRSVKLGGVELLLRPFYLPLPDGERGAAVALELERPPPPAWACTCDDGDGSGSVATDPRCPSHGFDTEVMP